MTATDYAARVKPYKVCETVHHAEIDTIREEAWRSRVNIVNIDDWADRLIADIDAAPQERMIAEYATREEADADATRRNRSARRGFTYDVVYLDTTLAELREQY